MEETLEIRKCLASDIARTGRFYDRVVLWLEGHVNYPLWNYGVYPCEQTVRAMTHTGAQYICLSGGTIVGAFALNAEPQGNYRNGHWQRDLPEGSYLVLHALAIDPGTHRQGLGTQIIRFCVDKAKAQGYRALRADIVPTNAPARRLFEKNGFTYAGDADLELHIDNIPTFSLYELNW